MACVWAEDEDGVHQTACGEAFAFNEGGHKNERFCFYCGHSIAWLDYEPEPEEPEADAAVGQS